MQNVKVKASNEWWQFLADLPFLLIFNLRFYIKSFNLHHFLFFRRRWSLFSCCFRKANTFPDRSEWKLVSVQSALGFLGLTSGYLLQPVWGFTHKYMQIFYFKLSIDINLPLNIYEIDFMVHFLTTQHWETCLMGKSNDLWAVKLKWILFLAMNVFFKFVGGEKLK